MVALPTVQRRLSEPKQIPPDACLAITRYYLCSEPQPLPNTLLRSLSREEYLLLEKFSTHRTAAGTSISYRTSDIMPSAVSDGPSVSLSFANNFWGKDDAGVDPLLTRMHNAKQTCDEVKAFYTSTSTVIWFVPVAD
jgi:hypothetical protein